MHMHVGIYILVSLHSIYLIYLKYHSVSVHILQYYIFNVAEMQLSWWGGRRTINKPLTGKQPFQQNASGKFSFLCETQCYLDHAGNEEAGGELNCAQLIYVNTHSGYPCFILLLMHLFVSSNCLILLLVEKHWPWVLHSSCFYRKSQDWAKEGHFHLSDVVTVDSFQISAAPSTKLFTVGLG